MRAAAPGAAAAAIAARAASTRSFIEELKKLYGFDKPPARALLADDGATSRASTSARASSSNKRVVDLINEKLPVSISLGLWTSLLTYLISIPLGIAKAVRDGSRFDVVDHAIVLVGYAIPGFVLRASLLIVLFGGGSFCSGSRCAA